MRVFIPKMRLSRARLPAVRSGTVDPVTLDAVTLPASEGRKPASDGSIAPSSEWVVSPPVDRVVWCSVERSARPLRGTATAEAVAVGVRWECAVSVG